ncbi:MAG: hypothetical protein M0Q92_00370 [Methanoregula sp.]|nr:hypothetical protein [Methanoregula sp.]
MRERASAKVHRPTPIRANGKQAGKPGSYIPEIAGSGGQTACRGSGGVLWRGRALTGTDRVTTRTTAPPAPTLAPGGSSSLPVVPARIGICGVGVIGGGWWIRRQNPARFAEYD